MPRQRIVTAAGLDEPQHDSAPRPKLLSEFIGQKAVVQQLGITLDACRKLKEPVPHILLDGPPGLGKTTIARILANELGSNIQMTGGPALRSTQDVFPFLTTAEKGSVLFIDDIHRLPLTVEQFIYPAMDDFRMDIVLGEGITAHTISWKVHQFTLVGVTPRQGLVSERMRELFKLHGHLELYSVEELAQIVAVNASNLQVEISEEAAAEIARRSRGSPCIANRHLSWARHFAASEADGRITLRIVQDALALRRVDSNGLDSQDRRYLETLIGVFKGGPTGVEALAATMNVPADELSDEIEPFLLREEFITRSPRGRLATPRAYQHLGQPLKPV
jgi:Holliday junction DNA helicase RuvB